jgi:hypothetical protein
MKCSGSRRHRGCRLARWSLGALAFLAAERASAQSPGRTTVGRLLGSPIDTIEVEQRDGGELGWKGASLRLVRVDSAYVGTLRMQSGVARRMNVAEQRCDTTETATMTAPAARRLFALLRPAVIEPGEAAPGLPIYDVWFDYSYKLASGRNAVVVRSGRTLEHGESRYRTPLKHDRRGRIWPPWPSTDANTPLMKAHELVQPYLQLDRLIAFARACRGE